MVVFVVVLVEVVLFSVEVDVVFSRGCVCCFTRSSDALELVRNKHIRLQSSQQGRTGENTLQDEV